ncbi:MAG: hypothetical protein ABJH98_18015 [Reichenbachiella sp.]|uniref:hypothetical protein n=1 Tax=Reichenbachiella sp. TaxID=2184521 RepID=UPI003298466F
MTQIPFITWVILFPIATAFVNYINAKRRQITKEERPTDKVMAFIEFVNLVIWAGVGYALFPN